MTAAGAENPGGELWDVPADADTETLRRALATAREALASRETQIRALVTQSDSLRVELAAGRRTIEETSARLAAAVERSTELEGRLRELATTNDSLSKRVAELVIENETLKARTGSTETPRSVKAFGDLLRDVRTSFEIANEAALRDATEGKAVYLVEQIEVEAKGGFDLRDEIKLVELEAEKLGPNTVSTVRFSLRPATQMRVEPDEPDRPPAAQPPQPR